MSLIILMFSLAGYKKQRVVVFSLCRGISLASDITHALFILTLNPNSSLSLQGSEIIQLTVIQYLLWTAAS